MRHTCGSGDLAKACALGMSLADRGPPGSVGLGATCCRPFTLVNGLAIAVSIVTTRNDKR